MIAEKYAEAADSLRDPERIMERIGEAVVLPMLGRRYDASGLRKRTGLMRTAVTQRGAQGNVFEVSGNRLTVGIDYAEVPYARYQLEGSMPHVIRPRKPNGLLRFYWEKLGKWVTLRKVNHPGTRARLVYRMDTEALQQARMIAVEAMGEDWTVSQR